MPSKTSTRPSLASEAVIELGDETIRCRGSWTLARLVEVERWLAARPKHGLEHADGESVARGGPTGTSVDASGIEALDTAGAWLLRKVVRTLDRAERRAVLTGLRPGHAALLAMLDSPAVRSAEAALASSTPPLGAVAQLGKRAATSLREGVLLLAFVGEVAHAALRALAQPVRIRWRPILHNVRTAGFDALPITGLLVFLMGIVIAYQGASQLRRYGANIFVADLVGLAMLRELSPLLTAIIVAGRSGSAYAAQIGTMKVTEEVDALRTVGIAPMEQLVLPKIAALTIALPLLTVYADALGVAGGMVMAKSELEVGFPDFLERLRYAIVQSDFLVGIGKAPVFAAIISLIGCFQGFQVAGDAESVGRRTTVSVVQSIFLVIVADALFSVVFDRLGI